MTLTYEEIVERLYVSAKKSYIWHQLSTTKRNGIVASDEWIHHSLRDSKWALSLDMKQRGVVYTGITK